MQAVILASGPSLTDEDIEYVRKAKEDGKTIVLAVSDVGLLKAPWADALCSHDSNWWMANPDALNFKGRRFSARGFSKTDGFDGKNVGHVSGVNSGLWAMYIARDIYKADRIILLGFDMHRRNGQHFFGEHKGKLTNTNEQRFQVHLKQFDRFSGCEVINCTKGSDLKRFPFGDLRDIIK
jgi:hypothetical protein